MNDIFKIKEQVAARLSAEETAYINENMETLAPGLKKSDPVRKFIVSIVNKALSKNTGNEETYKLEINRQRDKIGELEEKLTNVETLSISRTEEIEALQTENADLLRKIEDLENDKNNLCLSINKPNQVIIDLSPAEFAVTERFREKLSEYMKQPVQTSEMLFDLFWKYITQQKTRIAFPFFLSVSEIKRTIEENK